MISFLLGYGNIIDAATFLPAGNWLSGAPAANAGTWPLAESARSADVLTTSTILRWDNSAAKAARLLCIQRHNLRPGDTVRWTRGSTPGASDVADSGAVQAWQFTPRVVDGGVYDVQVVLGTQVAARYDQLEIISTANPDGYVDVGRLMVGPVFEPAINPEFDLLDGHEDLSVNKRAYSGASWPAPNRRLRKSGFVFDWLTLSEGDLAHELEQIEGTTGEVAWLPYVGDPARTQRFGLVGQMSSLDGVRYPRILTRGKGFSVTQRA